MTLRHTVQLCDIIGITACKKENTTTADGDVELLPCGSTAFSVHMVKKMRKHKWREKSIVFQCGDVVTCQNWIKKTRNALEAISMCFN